MMQMIVKLKKQTGAKRDFRSRPTNIFRISYLKVFAKSHIFFLLQNLISKKILKISPFLKISYLKVFLLHKSCSPTSNWRLLHTSFPSDKDFFHESSSPTTSKEANALEVTVTHPFTHPKPMFLFHESSL